MSKPKKLGKTLCSSATLPKIRLAWLYEDSDCPYVLLDEGQDFKKIFKEFNKQDQAMIDEPVIEGPAYKAWLGFSDFMKSKGVKILKAKETKV